MAIKKVGVIGSGQVAQVLAKGFLKHGYDVMIGSRDVAKLNEWKAKENVSVKVGTFEEAASHADLAVVAVKGTIAEDLVKSLAPYLKGKTVIDTNNPIADAPPENGVLKFFTDYNSSLMEQLQKAAPEAKFVKAFSCVGNALMVNPVLKEGKPSMFICGDDEGAKKDVGTILEQFGWEIEDMGKAVAARAIEPLCILWCIPGFLKNQWMHAYKVARP